MILACWACVPFRFVSRAFASFSGAAIAMVDQSWGKAVGPKVLLGPRQGRAAGAHGIVRAGFAGPIFGEIVVGEALTVR